jgi:HJR/Mrr/RecB family endonuclease
MVTGILSANAAAIEVSRQFTQNADLVLSIRDHLQGVAKVAVDLKAMQSAVDASAVMQLTEATRALNANRSILVTTSTFTSLDSHVSGGP